MVRLLIIWSGTLFWLAVGCWLLDADHSAVKLVEDTSRKLRLNVTANDCKKLICFIMLRHLIKKFEGELVSELIHYFFVQPDKKWKINVRQINVKLRLIILVILQRHRHCIQVLHNYLQNILDDPLSL